ncbi:hypothetical protein SAY87_023130 [Trapa incisa]|uniref:Uncharacterized protein n=1 Tax=Trapa incisa TaxID=236973 RepID=A0AAN7K583_9MYRT|nr:hypothetical protein SAY87_023130 [Trapa incisa]
MTVTMDNGGSIFILRNDHQHKMAVPGRTQHNTTAHVIKKAARARSPVNICSPSGECLPSSLSLSFYSSSSSSSVVPLSKRSMRKLCPNYDREDGLETVLEVPIPEETFAATSNRYISRSWQSMKAWMTRPSYDKSQPSLATLLGSGSRGAEVQLLFGVIGAPLIPLPITKLPQSHIGRTIKNNYPIEASMAKYIVQQYTAASGGETALNSKDSMYALGKVRMMASGFSSGEDTLPRSKSKAKDLKHGGGEMGGFVLWQKQPELWCLELVVSGYKISAGSDGKVAWRQTPWQHSLASRGPPRPLRRLIQGLDPRSTASLFTDAVCIGEKTINNEDCFVLKLETDSTTLKARSGSNVEMIRHTIWGCFSQRTGLLVQLQDSHLLRMTATDDRSIFWETTMESLIKDYRTIDGVNIAHAGRTVVSLARYGESKAPEATSRTRMEEAWNIEEVEFNIKGLTMDCFLPPADLKEDEHEGYYDGVTSTHPTINAFKVGPVDIRRSGSTRSNGGSRVTAMDDGIILSLEDI